MRDHVPLVFDLYEEAFSVDITVLIIVKVHQDPRVIFYTEGTVMKIISELLLIKGPYLFNSRLNNVGTYISLEKVVSGQFVVLFFIFGFEQFHVLS